MTEWPGKSKCTVPRVLFSKSNYTEMNVTKYSAPIFHEQWQWIYLTYITVKCLWGLLSLAGNSLTLYVIWKYDELRTTSNMMIVSLSLGDLLGGVCGTVLLVLYYSTVPTSQAWLAICCTEDAVFQISTGINISTICLISVDRYIYIHNPLRYHEIVKIRNIIGCIVCMWLYLITIMITVVIISADVMIETKMCSMTVASPVLYMSLVLSHFGLLSIITLTIYCKIAYTAYQQSRRIQTETLVTDHGSSVQLKITKMMGLVIGTYFALYLPGLLHGFIFNAIRKYEVGHFLGSVALLILHINTCINPIIYGFRSTSIKKAYKKRHFSATEIQATQILVNIT